MAYLPKSLAEGRVKVRTRKDRNGNEHTDYEAYVGVDPFSRKPVRITRATEADLKRALADFYARHRAGGDAAVRLTAMQALDAKAAYDALASAGVGKSLKEVVEEYLSGGFAERKGGCTLTVEEAWREYFGPEDGALYDESGNVIEHRRNAKYSIGKWVKAAGGAKLASVTAGDVQKYLEDNYGGRKPKTYNHHLLYLKTFFNWCCKPPRDYLAESPVRALEYRPEAWEEPEYMKVDDVMRLFALLEDAKDEHPDLLAYAVVNFFCGCRAVEVVRMATNPDACRVNVDGETVRIAKGKGFQQGKRPRAFQIHPTGLAWVKSFDFGSAVGMIRRKVTSAKLYDFARSHGVPVFRNCGRHTFITYHVAAYGDPAKTQAIVGTGGKMMAENYRGLATKREGDAYFAILPKGYAAETPSDERKGV